MRRRYRETQAFGRPVAEDGQLERTSSKTLAARGCGGGRTRRRAAARGEGRPDEKKGPGEKKVSVAFSEKTRPVLDPYDGRACNNSKKFKETVNLMVSPGPVLANMQDGAATVPACMHLGGV